MNSSVLFPLFFSQFSFFFIFFLLPFSRNFFELFHHVFWIFSPYVLFKKVSANTMRFVTINKKIQTKTQIEKTFSTRLRSKGDFYSFYFLQTPTSRGKRGRATCLKFLRHSLKIEESLRRSIFLTFYQSKSFFKKMVKTT